MYIRIKFVSYQQIRFVTMPYRRLPNTDVARLKALKQAYQKGKELPPFKLAFSQSTFNKVQSFLPNFEAVIRLYKNTYTSDRKSTRLNSSHT